MSFREIGCDIRKEDSWRRRRRPASLAASTEHESTPGQIESLNMAAMLSAVCPSGIVATREERTLTAKDTPRVPSAVTAWTKARSSSGTVSDATEERLESSSEAESRRVSGGEGGGKGGAGGNGSGGGGDGSGGGGNGVGGGGDGDGGGGDGVGGGGDGSGEEGGGDEGGGDHGVGGGDGCGSSSDGGDCGDGVGGGGVGSGG